MDRRETGPEKSAYLQDLEKQDEQEVDDRVIENGVEFRVPYKMIKQVVFRNVSKQELRDIEHAARLQYRLMLMDQVLRAKVEFVKQTITIVYNPPEAKNRKPKISLQELVDFLAKEGVHVDQSAANMQNTDYDYYKEIYQYEFNPPSIRERVPYSYTKEQWSKMKNEFWAKTAKQEEEKRDKFHRWQNEFAQEVAETDPELAKQLPKVEAKEEKSFVHKLFGKKKEKKQEKGFWFHGV